ncbi:MAG TPA: hypothetical protein VLB76_24750 [Thermoanaerobaculia bacterium]|jgi:hypothetical protein|nr:hypothetical protein [Thermoanaerobaculia bacterium]
MTDWIRIETRDGSTAFLPGETVEGTVAWHFDGPATSVELRLLWYTEGKGDQDIGVVETVPFADPEMEEIRPFHVCLPKGPFSFSGRLISLAWALEAVAEPGGRAERLALTVSPTRREILLPSGVAVAGAG